MKRVVCCMVLTVIFLSFFGGYAPSADAATVQTEAWRRYLSETEQATLAAITAAVQKQAEQAAPDGADPAAMLTAGRKGYEAFATEWAPPLPQVPTEAYDADGVKGLWFKPAGAAEDKALLYFHGGGYVVGTPLTGGAVAGFLAQQAGILCFSLDYPLAPEFPYPAAPDNALAAYRMLLSKGFAPENIVLAGDSAGGGLTVATLVAIRDSGLAMPAGAFLLSPWTDLSNSAASHDDKRDADSTVKREFLHMMAFLYANGKDVRTPAMSPVFAELHGLPPLLIHVGSHETLLDDSLTLARKAALADVPVKLMIWPGYQHVFQMMHQRLEGGRRSLEDAAKFFREVMGEGVLRAKKTAE